MMASHLFLIGLQHGYRQHYIVFIQRVYQRYNVMICENFFGDFFMLDKIEKVWICIEALIRDRICLDIA